MFRCTKKEDLFVYFQDWETEEFLQSYRHNLEPSSPPQVDGGGGGGGGASAEDAVSCVMNPDPHGSGTFSGSGSNKK